MFGVWGGFDSKKKKSSFSLLQDFFKKEAVSD
jgi:hypothetical protein